MDISCGYSKDERKSIKCLIGDNSDFKADAKGNVVYTLNIVRNFQILNTEQFHKKGRHEHLDIFKDRCNF